MSYFKPFVLTAALVALCAESADAQFTGSGCGGSSDGGNAQTICAWWNLTFAGDAYTLTVTNNSANTTPEGSRIDKIGLGAANGSQFTNIRDFSSLPTGWKLEPGNGNWLNGFGMLNLVFDATTVNNSQKKGYFITSGETYTFTWKMNGSGASIDQIGFHDLQGSTKVCFDGVTGDVCGTNTVPEPATIALVASGLVGLAPFARRRRKTKS